MMVNRLECASCCRPLCGSFVYAGTWPLKLMAWPQLEAQRAAANEHERHTLRAMPEAQLRAVKDDRIVEERAHRVRRCPSAFVRIAPAFARTRRGYAFQAVSLASTCSGVALPVSCPGGAV